MKKDKSPFILHPLLFGIYPVLILLANNFNELLWTNSIRSLISSGILSLVIYLTLLLFLKSPQKAALLALILLILFYSYGHLYYLLRNVAFGDFVLGHHRFLGPIYLIAGILAVWLTIRIRRDTSRLTVILNFAGIVLVVFPLIQILISIVLTGRAAASHIVSLEEPAPSKLPTSPNVYYILVDGYPRADFIQKYMGLDISPFINTLSQVGFFVPTCSQANYTDTRFSMASTLNMTYLDRSTGDPEVLYSGYELDFMIKENLVQEIFTDLGYTIVTFESGYRWLDWENSDFHLRPSLSRENTFFNVRLNEFEQLLLDTSLGKLILDTQFLLTQDALSPIRRIVHGPREAHRNRVLFTLDELPRLEQTIPSSKFVYAHIVFPHPPFIVDASGNPLNNDPPNELAAYAEQIRYLNSRLIAIVDSIIRNSVSPPIIIIQGDHGATIDYDKHNIPESERLGIFSAYYLPGIDYGVLQETFSPVNNFRLIFDTYFEGNYGLLEDRSIIGRQSPYTRISCVGK